MIVLCWGMLVGLLYNTVVWGYSVVSPYQNPERVYRDTMGFGVTVSGKVGLNEAGLNELLTVPGMNQSMAVKVMKARPFSGWEDLYRLPGVDQQQVDAWLARVRPYVSL